MPTEISEIAFNPWEKKIREKNGSFTRLNYKLESKPVSIT
jgi:hypothetical protein